MAFNVLIYLILFVLITKFIEVSDMTESSFSIKPI